MRLQLPSQKSQTNWERESHIEPVNCKIVPERAGEKARKCQKEPEREREEEPDVGMAQLLVAAFVKIW